MTTATPQKALRQLLSIVVIGVLAVAFAGCSSSDDDALAQEMVTSVDDFATEWNRNNLRWVTALTDPEVSYGDFVSIQQDVGVDQLQLLTDFDMWIQSLDPDVRPAVIPILENYQGRFQAMIDEVFPAALGDDEAVLSAAASRYLSFSSPENVEPAVRAFVFYPLITNALRSEGIEPEVYMQSFMRSLGG